MGGHIQKIKRDIVENDRVKNPKQKGILLKARASNMF